MSDSSIGKLIAVIGGIVILVEGIISLLYALGTNLGISWWGMGGYGIGWFGTLGAVVWSIIVIIVGFIILIATGVIKSKGGASNGLVVLILGIVAFLIASNLGGILVILGGILMLIL